MEYNFEIEKIVNYLKQFKDNLPSLYTWKAKIDKLVELGVLEPNEIDKLNKLNSYDREIILKNRVNIKIHDSYKNDKENFDKLCLWIIKDWGGILTAKDKGTIELISTFLNNKTHSYKRIASASKVGAYMYPEKYIIYDSRVAYSLNWIILSENAGNIFFPIPSGRNSKMVAFDMNVLIRMKNVLHYTPIKMNNTRYKKGPSLTEDHLKKSAKRKWFSGKNFCKNILCFVFSATIISTHPF